MACKVFFRTDGNGQIGLGHITRCLALAQMLQSKFAISFFCKEIPVEIKEVILNRGFEVNLITSEDLFLSVLHGNEIVVVDHYDFDIQYYNKIKQQKSKLVVIDDLHTGRFNADLIINHAPGILPADYNSGPSTIFALGTEFLLLRPSFLAAAKNRKVVQTIETILVCFGGSDPDQLTGRIAKLLVDKKKYKKVILVYGAAATISQQVVELVNVNQNLECHQGLSEEQMFEVMLKADLAIVPSSGILLEVLSVGCKVISGYYIANQKIIFDRFKNLGLILSAEDFSTEKINQALNQVNSFASRQDFTFDGNSDKKLLKLFISLSDEYNIVLRNANSDDLYRTFEWAANQIIRRYSFNQAAITFEEHSNWFLRKIRQPDCYYFLAIQNDVAIGSIRFDLKDRTALISYLLDPNFHQKGLGSVLLKMGVEKLLQQTNLQLSEIIGFVQPENVASVKAFEKLGFNMEREGDNFKFSKRIG
jgi:UDP-2,4-diacetamido-2,4,6-trideoxy-beta-L-altropyranose hydrolase